MNYLTQKPADSTERVILWLLWFIRFDILAGIAWMLIIGNWEAFFINITALGLTFVPAWAANKYKIKLPIDYVFLIGLFIYLSMVLGSVYEAYERFFWWDAVLHTASGIMLSYGVFLAMFILYKNKKIEMSPFLIAVFTFSFGLALGGVWEIFEFSVDSIFGTNMQRNGLQDTMWDLIVDAAGSLVVAWVGYDIIKNNREQGFMYKAIDRCIRTKDRK